MIQTIQGNLNAQDKRFALVTGRFNDLVTAKLAEGAVDCLLRHGAAEADITQIKVPGAFEIPAAAAHAAASPRFDAVIALGAVIRGDTPHFDYVAAETAKGLGQLSLQTGKPVLFGVLTTDTLEQALERAGTKGGNKGWDAALSAIEMVRVTEVLGQTEAPG